MKLLIVAPFCSLPGEPYFNRFLYLAQLASASHDVTLLTSSFSHFSKRQRGEAEKGGDFRIVHIHEPGYRKNVSLRRVLSHGVFVKNFRQWLLDTLLEESFDVVYSAYPLLETNIVLGRLKRQYGFKLVVDVQDVWPEAISAALPFVKAIPRRLLPFSAKADRAYAAADALVAVSETYLARARAVNGSVPSMVTYIGSDRGAVEGIAPATMPRGPTRFFYIGTLSHSYDIETVIAAFNRMAGEGRPFELHIFGDGPDRPRLQRLAGSSIHFHGLVGYRQMIAEIKAMDVAVNAIKAHAQPSITNKLSDYFGIGKPVLNSQTNKEAVKLIGSMPHAHYRAGDASSCAAAAEAIARVPAEAPPASLVGLFDRAVSYPRLLEFVERIAK